MVGDGSRPEVDFDGDRAADDREDAVEVPEVAVEAGLLPKGLPAENSVSHVRDLDALLRDAQAFATGVAVQATGTVPVQVMGDTDAAKEARLDGLLDDVAAATRGLSGDGDDPLVELASRFVAAVEAPGISVALLPMKSRA